MKDKTKKTLILALCGVVSVGLIIGIALTLQKPAAQDNLLGEQDQITGEVNPSTNPATDADPIGDEADDATGADDDALVINIQQPDASQDTAAGAGDSTGTEQTIQSDATKPEAEEDALKDPTKTPDGQPVDGTPEPVDHDAVTTPAPSSSEPQAGDKNDKGQVWFPGFGWVEDSGSNTENVGDSDGDINKPVGIMGE